MHCLYNKIASKFKKIIKFLIFSHNYLLFQKK